MKQINEKPTARIAIKKNVLKTYEVDYVKTVYLKDETEFEIELFNPLKKKVLCKIKLNGLYINGQGLVLNPGQRVFLERYLDEDRKFKFSTYIVDKTFEVENAIKNNGNVEVEFYEEKEFQMFYDSGWSTWGSGTYRQGFYYNSIVSPLYTGTITTSSTMSNNSLSTIDNNSNAYNTVSYTVPIETKETGVIEKGEKSKQNLVDCYNTFNNYTFNIEKIKILPESQKVYTVDDTKHKRYCPNCGSKVKEGDNFCSLCGHKL